MEMGSSGTPNSVALIVGVTGMVGFSLAEALKKQTISGNDMTWKVYGIARSTSLPTWFPSSLIDDFISVDLLDQETTTKKLTPISSEITHIFWVALQVCENEESNISTNSKMLTNVLDVMKSAGSSSRLKHITLQTGTKHYMGPVFDPKVGHHVLVLNQDPPFKEDLPRLPYPNFYYALEDLVASYIPSITYFVHRSSITIGASSRSFYNFLLSFSIYGNICLFKGLPFKYPGSKYVLEHFGDMSDSGLQAEQHIWAAVSGDEGAKNQAFNCSNGDVFTWKKMWKELSEIFNVGFVENEENEEFDWGKMMRENREVWDEIVDKYGLFKTKMDDVVCYDAVTVVSSFKFQHVSCMNKSPRFWISWVQRFIQEC
ncbi:(S)-8-oxocitronellyl enol synthase [Euphorbia peplus]|nr:(S)-8-oxocitronellyl enol synthase [Euphorbia peplus]